MLSGLGIALGFTAPIILALMINEIPNERFKRYVQTVTYAPNFISAVVMVSIILTLLNPRIGVVGHIIELVRAASDRSDRQGSSFPVDLCYF